MKKYIIGLLSILLLLFFAGILQAAGSAVGGEDYAPGEVLVRLKEGISTSRRAEVLQCVRVERTHEWQRNSLRLKLAAGQDVQQAVVALRKDPDVLLAQPNFRYHALVLPNDTYFSQQWNMTRINMPAAWDVSRGSAGIVIAVIDSGVDLQHPDLAAKLTPSATWRDFVDGDSIPDDLDGHGTHVAGIAAAATNNALGVAGVGWQNAIMPVRVLDANGDGYTDDIVRGIDWAVAQGAEVINLSLGSPSQDSFLRSAVEDAYNAGVVLVAASGNKRAGAADSPFYPAAYGQVIAVAATDRDNGVADFSVRGSYVDVAAPGDGILSTYINSDYDTFSGTSMASPHVAGLCALMLSLNPALSPAEVKTLLQDNALDIAPAGPDTASGYGLIDAAATLQAIGGGSIRITTPTALPFGIRFLGYEEELAATGGSQPYTWSLQSGSLPSGLTLTADGLITGIPTVAGTFAFTVRATDSSSPALSATRAFTLVIEPPLTATIPAGVSLISLPFDPQNGSPEALLGLSGSDDAAWWNPDADAYDYYSLGSASLDDLQPGIGYWTKLSSARMITAFGDLIGTDYTVSLRPGWNQIGLPYPESYYWGDLRIRMGSNIRSISQAASAGWVENYGWFYENGTYLLAASSGGDSAYLEPWRGYWIYAFEPVELLFTAAFAGSASGTAATGLATVPSEWAMEITVASPHGSDRVLLGMAAGNSAPRRLLKPPALAGMAYLGINGAGQRGSLILAGDIRGQEKARRRNLPLDAARGVWELTLRSGAGAGTPARLTWDFTSAARLPGRLLLIDRLSGREVNMLTTGSYDFTADAGMLPRFRIEARTDMPFEEDNRRDIIRDGVPSLPPGGEDDGDEESVSGQPRRRLPVRGNGPDILRRG